MRTLYKSALLALLAIGILMIGCAPPPPYPLPPLTGPLIIRPLPRNNLSILIYAHHFVHLHFKILPSKHGIKTKIETNTVVVVCWVREITLVGTTPMFVWRRVTCML